MRLRAHAIQVRATVQRSSNCRDLDNPSISHRCWVAIAMGELDRRRWVAAGLAVAAGPDHSASVASYQGGSWSALWVLAAAALAIVRRADRMTASSAMWPWSSTKTPFPTAKAASCWSIRRCAALTSAAVGVKTLLITG